MGEALPLPPEATARSTNGLKEREGGGGGTLGFQSRLWEGPWPGGRMAAAPVASLPATSMLMS